MKNNVDINKIIKIVVIILAICLAWQIVSPLIGFGVYIVSNILSLLIKLGVIAIIVLVVAKLVNDKKNK